MSDDKSPHGRKIKAARNILDRLEPFERTVVHGLIRSSEQSQRLNQRSNREYREALARVAELEAENARLRELLGRAVEMTGEPSCFYDHHGYCQAHNLEPKGECWVELSLAQLKNTDTNKEIGE